MATAFHVEVVTPERVLYSGEADEVSLRTDAGEIAFLAHHEDFVGAVDITLCAIHLLDPSQGDGELRRIAVHGGFVYVADNQLTLLASVAELGEEIDVERAREALARAEGALPLEGAPAEHGGEEEHEASAGALSSTMLALLAPDAPEAAARRARARLEAAGAAPAA